MFYKFYYFKSKTNPKEVICIGFEIIDFPDADLNKVIKNRIGVISPEGVTINSDEILEKYTYVCPFIDTSYDKII